MGEKMIKLGKTWTNLRASFIKESKLEGKMLSDISESSKKFYELNEEVWNSEV